MKQDFSDLKLDRVTRRRLVLGLLLAASLALLTVYFREQQTGQLHAAQSSLSDAASPVEGAASSPSHITLRPRTKVPTGQPVTVFPS